jgi:hypothetical protein
MMAQECGMIRRAFIVRLCAPLLAGVLAGPVAASEKKAEKKEPVGRFVQIGGVSATIPKRGGRRGVLSVECGLDIADEKLRERASISLPRLRAAYVQAIQTYAAGMTPGDPPDPDQLARTLQRQTDLVLGKPGAKLLLGSLLIS